MHLVALEQRIRHDGRLVVGIAAALEGPLLGRPPAGVVAQAVQRDRVEPGLLGAAPGIEAAPAAQDAFEGVAEQVLGERPVAGAVDEEGEQWTGVGGVESLEVLVSQRSCPFRGEPSASSRRRLARAACASRISSSQKEFAADVGNRPARSY